MVTGQGNEAEDMTGQRSGWIALGPSKQDELLVLHDTSLPLKKRLSREDPDHYFAKPG